MEQTVKGIFLKNFVDFVRKTKGPTGLEQLKQKVGDINYSLVKNYSLEKEIELHKAIIKIVYGEFTTTNCQKLGEVAFNAFVESLVGKTIFALFGEDVKKAALGVQMALNTVTSGLDVHVEDLGKNKVKILMEHSLYPIAYYQGVWMAALKYLKKKGTVEIQEIVSGTHEYIVSWE